MTALPSPPSTSHKLAAVLRQDRVAILLMAAGFAVIAALAAHGHLVDQLIVVPVASFEPPYGYIETPFVSELRPIFILISYFWLGGFAVASAILIAVDMREHLLPNVVVVPLAAWLTVGAALLAVVSGTTEPLVRFVVGGVVVGVVMFAIALFSRAGFGGGDVKLAAVVAALSAWLSWPSVLITFGFALGAAAGVVIVGMTLGRMNRSTPIPFGPFLIAGTWIAIATFSLTEPPV